MNRIWDQRKGGDAAKSYMPVIIHIGPNCDAFEKLFQNATGYCRAQFVNVDSKNNLKEALSQFPRAVLIFECTPDMSECEDITSEFPEATTVLFANRGVGKRNIIAAGVFDVVRGTDPGWRLLLSLRNAIEHSLFRELCADMENEIHSEWSSLSS